MKKLQSLLVAVFCLSLVLLMCGANAAFAQEVTATITGTITDQSGAAIAGANCHCQVRRARHHLYGHVQRFGLYRISTPPRRQLRASR